jgi:MoxR-like ATPase
LSLLSALAGESIFLLGPPGVAKSLIARKLKFAFRHGQVFRIPDEQVQHARRGIRTVSIRKLKEEDKYERLTDKYLPGANVVFLDELWKAGPSIQNALLTILNEKIYRNGEQAPRVEYPATVATLD